MLCSFIQFFFLVSIWIICTILFQFLLSFSSVQSLIKLLNEFLFYNIYIIYIYSKYVY